MIKKDKVCDYCNKTFAHKRKDKKCCSKKCSFDLMAQKRMEKNSYDKLKKEDVVLWLKENVPNIKLIKWSGRAYTKSTFVDENRNIIFDYSFKNMKNVIRANSNNLFGASKKEIMNKVKKTNLERYGVECNLPLRSNQEKVKKTNLEKYGVEYPFLNHEIQEKYKRTCVKKYDVEHPWKNKEIYRKVRKSNIKNGRWNIIDGKTISEWAEDDNLASATTILSAHKMGIHPSKAKSGKSILEIKVENLFKKLGIAFLNDEKLPEHKDYKEGYNRPDFLIENLKLIIECDGDYPHANPNYFKSNDLIKFSDKKQMLAHEIWTKDKKRDEEYRKHGYILLKFWGSEIMNDWSVVEDKISTFLKKAQYEH